MTEIEKLIEALEQCATIGDAPIGPGFGAIVSRQVARDAANALRRTAEDDKARGEGRSEKLALSMRAGARAIIQNKRYRGATYVYDVFGAGKEISYFEAANLLCQEAEAALNGGGEGEA